MTAIYDSIGSSYSRYRQPDRRIEGAIGRALGGAARVANIGAGTGSYEHHGRDVVAVEPSRTMIAQRARTSAPVVQAIAECLPFGDAAFDAALAVLTVHHWSDARRGLWEMRRIAPVQVVLTWDPAVAAKFWLIEEYLPSLAEFEQGLPTLAAICGELPVHDVQPVPVPWDCTDGFLGAYWRRPGRYLDPAARGAISGLSLIDAHTVGAAMRELEGDIADGSWADRHRVLADLSELDLGYRLIIAVDR